VVVPMHLRRSYQEPSKRSQSQAQARKVLRVSETRSSCRAGKTTATAEHLDYAGISDMEKYVPPLQGPTK
jgi:hypothetical protein